MFPFTVRFRLFSDRIYPFSYYRLSCNRFRSRLSGSRSRFCLKIWKQKRLSDFPFVSVRFHPLVAPAQLPRAIRDCARRRVRRNAGGARRVPAGPGHAATAASSIRRGRARMWSCLQFVVGFIK